MIIKIIQLIFCSAFVLIAQIFTEAGRFGGKGHENGKLNNPLAIDVSVDNIVYIVDSGNNRIQLFDRRGSFIKSVGGFGFENKQFDAPRDIWINSLINIYVSDYNNQRVQRYDRHMNFINSLTSNEGQVSDFQFAEIASCAVNSQNDLFLVDHGDYKIIKFKRDGSAERVFGRFDSGDGELVFPEQIAMWGADKVVVADPGQSALIIFDQFGNFVSKLTHDSFKQPRGLDVDRDKNIFVADPHAKKIFWIHDNLSKIFEIKPLLAFTSPKDVAVVNFNNQKMLYVIDEDEIILGSLHDMPADKNE